MSRGEDQRVEAGALESVDFDPAAVLERGYAIVTADDGRVLSDARDIRVGDDVGLTLAKGRAQATVTATQAAHGESNGR